MTKPVVFEGGYLFDYFEKNTNPHKIPFLGMNYYGYWEEETPENITKLLEEFYVSNIDTFEKNVRKYCVVSVQDDELLPPPNGKKLVYMNLLNGIIVQIEIVDYYHGRNNAETYAYIKKVIYPMSFSDEDVYSELRLKKYLLENIFGEFYF